MTLEAYVMVNAYQAKALYDTGTFGDNVISGKFVTMNRIAIKNLEVSISLKIVVKRSRSSINYKAKPVIQIDIEVGKIIEALVSSLENYDIFLGMPYLNCHQAVIKFRIATTMFPKTE
jgi:hypothetical protein